VAARSYVGNLVQTLANRLFVVPCVPNIGHDPVLKISDLILERYESLQLSTTHFTCQLAIALIVARRRQEAYAENAPRSSRISIRSPAVSASINSASGFDP